MLFGEKVKMLREKKNISLNQFAKIIGVSPAYLSNLENGKTDTVQLSVLHKIHDQLGIQPIDTSTTDSIFEIELQYGMTLLRQLHKQNPKSAHFILKIMEQSDSLLDHE